MMLINPYSFGATLSTVINYQFMGADGATTTTDSTGNTTASGLGVFPEYASYADISSNTLRSLRKAVTIDNSGSLSSYLIFAGDFEVELSIRVDFWSFAGTCPFWTLLNGSGQTVLNLNLAGDGSVYLQSVTDSNLLQPSGSLALAGGVDLTSQQPIKVARVGSVLSVYVGGVLKGTTTSTGTVNAGRLSLNYDDIEHFTDYLIVKKV